jgi:hypothetical protein
MHRLNIDKDGKLYWFSNRELFVSLDDGVSWQKKALPNLWSFNSKTGYGEDKHIQTVMIDPRQSGVIHLVLRNTSLEHFSVEAWAILKSTDYGTTWQTPKGVKTPVAYLRTPDGSIADNGTMSIDLFSQNVRYSSNTSGGLFKSTDNGVTYQMVGSLPAGVSADGSGWGLSPINQNTLFNWGGDIVRFL